MTYKMYNGSVNWKLLVLHKCCAGQFNFIIFTSTSYQCKMDRTEPKWSMSFPQSPTRLKIFLHLLSICLLLLNTLPLTSSKETFRFSLSPDVGQERHWRSLWLQTEPIIQGSSHKSRRCSIRVFSGRLMRLCRDSTRFILVMTRIGCWKTHEVSYFYQLSSSSTGSCGPLLFIPCPSKLSLPLNLGTFQTGLNLPRI
ncbi:hypothetical protein FA15DRAFT_115403 [Coprinopsis marcescibilis]|uniref:Uncharacterized protein n=1 Tax=Coprinopsis marcescibilis TaxID=230819 RepID=A0A5C3KKE3_COPMA|nr:hypothetical protein FA15DRAFT_115403 [Coprinopsis marcescibilis]